jgi:hypothetical protein
LVVTPEKPLDGRTKAWLSKQARLLNKSRQAADVASSRVVALGGMDLASVRVGRKEFK